MQAIKIKSAMGGNGKAVVRKIEASTIANARLQGIACALGELAEAHMEPDLAQMVLSSLDLSLSDLEAAGADSFDLARRRGDVQKF